MAEEKTEAEKEEQRIADDEVQKLADEEAAKLEGDKDGEGTGEDEGEIPLFMQELADDSGSDSVPLGAHVKAKDKLKGRISERDEEIEKLKAENEQLKTSKPEVKVVKRPRVGDFETDDEYETAMDTWEQDSARNTYDTYEQSKNEKEQANLQATAIKESVESHYDRAQKLVDEHSISPEVYKKADAEVRAAVASVHKKNADYVTDAFISALGEGSEKALFYIGRNKNALNEFKALLGSDKTGLKVASFLGEIKGRVKGITKQKSRAPAPGANLNGESASPKGSADKRKYDKAHKSKDGQAAYNIKKNARAAGVDTSNW